MLWTIGAIATGNLKRQLLVTPIFVYCRVARFENLFTGHSRLMFVIPANPHCLNCLGLDFSPPWGKKLLTGVVFKLNSPYPPMNLESDIAPFKGLVTWLVAL